MGSAPRSWALAAAIGALWCWMSPGLHATTVLALDGDTLIQKAELIVQAACTHLESYRDPDGRIVTRYSFRVLKTLKGSEQSTLTFVQPGGEVQGVATVIPGLSHFSVGDEVVLFLGPEERYRLPVGLNQGVFRVQADPKDGQLRVQRSVTGLHLLPSSGKPLPSNMLLEEFLELVRAGVARTSNK
ncbi:MAG: hypothetical protein V3T77_04045 [Planctomycetota bacterium]